MSVWDETLKRKFCSILLQVCSNSDNTVEIDFILIWYHEQFLYYLWCVLFMNLLWTVYKWKGNVEFNWAASVLLIFFLWFTGDLACKFIIRSGVYKKGEYNRIKYTPRDCLKDSIKFSGDTHRSWRFTFVSDWLRSFRFFFYLLIFLSLKNSLSFLNRIFFLIITSEHDISEVLKYFEVSKKMEIFLFACRAHGCSWWYGMAYFTFPRLKVTVLLVLFF